MKRKILIGIGAFFALLIIAAACVALWQWSNIKALYIGLTTDEETLQQQIGESNRKLAEEVKEYMQGSIRDFTDEELAMIESGEKTQTDILAQILSEAASENEQEQAEAQEQTNGAAASSTRETADQIVARHVANLYAYQGEFQAKVDSLAASASEYVKSYKASNPNVTWAQAKAAAISNFMSTATSIESECYAKVDNEIAALKADLSAIGADLSIADTVAASAENQMQLQKSKIVSQYRSKMGS